MCSLLCLYGDLPARAGTDLRTIRVGIAVAPSFMNQPNWRSEFGQRLAYASRIFESEFKIRFVATKWYEWSGAKEHEESQALLEDLMSHFPLGDVDLVIGLTSLKKTPSQMIRDPHTIGQARPLSGYLVLRYPTNRLFKIQEQTVLVHELGHLFGAIHTDRPSTIMYPLIDKQLPSHFDQENRDIIMETRGIDFKKGIEALPKDSIQRLLGSYIKLIAENQPFDFFYMLGVLYVNIGQYDNALGTWKKAAAILPNYARIHYDLGMLYYQMGSQQNAIRELSWAVQGFRFSSENQEKVRALVALGSVFQTNNDLTSAQSAFSRALALDPKNREIKLNLAIVLIKKGQWDTAIRQLEGLLFQDPHNPKILGNLGIAFFEAKRFSESARYLNRALEKVKPGSLESVEIHNYLAKIYYQTNQPQKSIEHFQTSCNAAPNAECMKGLAQMYFQQGQWDSCIQTLATVLKNEKEDADVYGTLGVAFIRKGDYGNALPVLREGLRYTNDNKKAALFYQNIGHIMLQMQQYDFAEKEFLMGISRDWKNIECHQGLGFAYLGGNKFTNARKEFEDILRIDPKNQTAKKMIQDIDKIMKQPLEVDFQIQG